MTSVTPDYPDFTQGVGVLDQAATLTTANQLITSNGAAISFDTSKLATLIINLQLPPGSGGGRFRLAIQWSDGGFTTVQDAVTFHSAASYQGGQQTMQWQFPAKGGTATIQLLGDTNAACNIIVVGSTRVTDAPQINFNQGDDDRLILDIAPITVPAGGASAVYFVPPVARAYHFDLVTTLAGIIFAVTGVTKASAGMSVSALSWFYATSQRVNINDWVMPNVGLQVQISNTTAGASNVGMTIWDVS